MKVILRMAKCPMIAVALHASAILVYLLDSALFLWESNSLACGVTRQSRGLNKKDGHSMCVCVCACACMKDLPSSSTPGRRVP